MPFFHMPSKALIDALGVEAVGEIESYFEDVAEEIRAERRRLESAQVAVEYPARTPCDALWRLADIEYHLRIEISEARRRLHQDIDNLRDEVRRLRDHLGSSVRGDEDAPLD